MNLEKIVYGRQCDRFFRITNAEGKMWLLPLRNIRMAMELYQPSGYRGKILKCLLPLLSYVQFLSRYCHTELTEASIEDSLLKVFQRVFANKNIEYSIFFGSPGPRQKITIQIYNENTILGYAKISDNLDVVSSFYQEMSFLQYLSEKGIKNIPSILFCEKLDDYFVFIQTTCKTIHSTVFHKITPFHIDFAKEIYEKTKTKIPFVETGLYNDLRYLESILDNIATNDREILRNGINSIVTYYHGDVEFGAIHGDFTPWNSYFESGELFTFDYEYGAMGYPAYMDIIHFELQIDILVKNLTIEEAFVDLQNVGLKIPVRDIKPLVISYLLRVFSLYSRLFCGNFSPQDRSYKMWIGLIDKYNKS